jgi:hypothetical protein
VTQAVLAGLPKAMALAWAVLATAGVARLDPPPDGRASGCGPSSREAGRTATGTMTAFDPATRALTVASAKGSVVYRVASDARAWLGRKRLPVRQLPSHVGAQVTLAWSEVDGVRTTHTVRLEEPGAGWGR